MNCNFKPNLLKDKKSSVVRKRHWLLIICMGLLGALPASAQHAALTEKITIDLSQTNALQVIEALDKQSRYSFTYAKEQLLPILIPSFKADSMLLGEALSLLEKKYGLLFTVVGSNIIVKAGEKIAEKKDLPGAITGKVVDFENGDPLVGATVSIEGINFNTTTDEKGEYRLNVVPAGNYTLLISYVGYKKDRVLNVKTSDNNATSVDVKLQASSENTGVMTGVVVSAIRNRRVANTTDAQLVNEIYSAKSVVSGISNEQIARTLDRDAAEVVKRIPGVNISGDNFIIVRGLNKRYNLTFLNDAMAPAADADSRSFSYDVISSNAIDRIMVYKSPSPDLPGEFSGGLVKIYTKKSQLTRQVDIQLSTQYRPGSTFDDVWAYAGGKTDFLGFDDGTRKLPTGIPRAANFNHLTTAGNAQYSSQFKNIYVMDKNRQALPDLRFNLNYYDAWKIGGKYLKNLTAISYSNTHEQRVTEQNSFTEYHDSRGTQGIHASRISAIQSNEYQFSDRLSFELRNFFNVNNQRIGVEDYRLLDDYGDFEFRHVNLYYVENIMYSGQLGGKYLFGKEKQNTLSGNLSYSTIHKQEPDTRDYTLMRPIQQTNGKDVPDEQNPWLMRAEYISFYLLTRAFNDVKENTYQGNIDLNYRINKVWGFKTGFYHESRIRDFSSRNFILNNGDNLYDPNLVVLASTKPGQSGGLISGGIDLQEKYLQRYFDPSMFREDGTGYKWYEKTTPNNQYYADNVMNAGYLSTDFNLLNGRLNIFGGLRVEDNRFRILGSFERGLAAYPLMVDKPVTSVLPSINMAFRADSNFVIRASYGKTVNRPEFREAAPMQYTSYLDQETYSGNPLLTTVNIHNTELRLEWYPNSARHNEMINVGFFYKHLDQPIERFRSIFSEGFDQFFYSNTGKTYIYGMEGEFRKSFDFIPGKFFRDLAVVFNGSWFKSQVDVPSLPFTGFAGGRKRPMQGQSPYLLNASLNYENAGTGTKVALSYNRAGDYIYAIGANESERRDADIMMQGRDQLDITWRQRINKLFSISAGVQNVLNAPILLYQDWTRNYHYNPSHGTQQPPTGGDAIFRRYYQRPYYSFGVNMIL